MRTIRAFFCWAILAALLWPEKARYFAERKLRVGEELVRLLVSQPDAVADRAALENRITALALSAAEGLPSDPRPWILAGNVRLIAAEPERALGSYRRALACGERAETDLHLARAYEMLGSSEEGMIADVRGIWIAPAFARFLTPDVVAPVRAQVARLEADLRQGRLETPPPLPQ